jgi:phosphopentomutase
VTRRAAIVVLDGVGIGAAPDAAVYGDAASNTLGNIATAVGGLRLPNLERAGLGRIAALMGVEPVPSPTAAFGLMQPASAGKDSTAGHWELAGVHLERPFPTYPNGFPSDVLEEFSRRTGRGVLGNTAASGTAIIKQSGEAHQRTGAWIVYTSADSVFQVAAHEETVALDELYRACEVARAMLVAPNDVSRVIARPFTGKPRAYQRTSNRRDFSIQPPTQTLLDALEAAGIPRVGVGKVDDLFARRGITATHSVDKTRKVSNSSSGGSAVRAMGSCSPTL